MLKASQRRLSHLTRKYEAAGWHGWAMGAHGEVETSRGKQHLDHRECWEPDQEVFPIREAL